MSDETVHDAEIVEPGAELEVARETFTPAKTLGGIPHLQEYLTMAAEISNTAMVPRALRSKPQEVLAVMMYGAELGIGPMQALQQINFIADKPSASAELLRALVMEAGHQFIIDANLEVATAHCKRTGWDEWRETTFTWDDAVRAHLTGGDGWKKYPDQMLAARVTSKACRMFFPDVISGMSYTPEEVESFSLPEASQHQGREPKPATPAGRERSAPVPLASTETLDRLKESIALLSEEDLATFKEKWTDAGIPQVPYKDLTQEQAEQGLKLADEIINRVAEPGVVAGLAKREEPASQHMISTVSRIARDLGDMTPEAKCQRFAAILGRDVTAISSLTASEATVVADALRAQSAEAAKVERAETLAGYEDEEPF